MSKSTKEQMNTPASGMIPSPWSRRTVADGSWMQKYTIGKLSARDDFLADQLDENVSAISTAINTVDNKVETVSGDLNTVSSKLENLSPLTYRGNNRISILSGKTDARNGDVYSITSISGEANMPKSGYWWYGGTTKSCDNDFKVKKNDEVAWTSGDPTQSIEARWFPIGQDIHVDYSAGENIEITEDNVINISGRVTLNCEPPIIGALSQDGSTYNIGFSPITMTAKYVSATEENNDTNNRPLTWYNTGASSLYYNTGVYVNGNTFYAQNISSTNITALTAIGNSAKYTNVSAASGRFTYINTDKTDAGNTDYHVLWTNNNGSYNQHLWVSDNYRWNPGAQRLKVPNISSTNITALTATGNSAKFTNISATNITGNLTSSAAQPKINMLYTAALADEISYSSSNPKLYFSGKNGGSTGTNTAEGALVFTYFNKPRRFGSLLQNYDGVGGWFGFSMKDDTDKKVGVISDLYSATSAVILTVSGNMANFGNISGTNVRAYTIVSNSAYPLPKKLFNSDDWNMGDTQKLYLNWDPYCRYFNIWNPKNGSTGHSNACGRYLIFDIETTYESECTFLSYAVDQNSYFNLLLRLSGQANKNEWQLGMLTQDDHGYYKNKLTPSTANGFNISIGGGFLTTKVIVSPINKFIVVKGGCCKFQGAWNIQ